MKIRIKTGPPAPIYQSGGSPSTGDQQNLGLFTNQTVRIDPNDYNRPAGIDDVRTTYPEVPAEQANVEVEKGEVVVSPDLATIYKAGGKKHSAGGTKIKAQEGAYIVSDFIKTDPRVLQTLGFDPEKDGKQTWAKLLQSKVDPAYYNTLASVLSDKEKGKDVDPYLYNTAKVKMPGLQEIVSKVALGNELSKAVQGKQYNIPQIAGLAMQGLQYQEPKPGDQPLTEAKMGGSYLPKAQSGKSVSSDLFNPFWNYYLNEHPEAQVSPDVQRNPNQVLSSPQHKITSGVYGNNWDLNEFKQRHDWYFKDHPNFNPQDPQQVKDFQQKYNSRASSKFGQPYFYGNQDFRAIDGKLGKYTYNAPNLSDDTAAEIPSSPGKQLPPAPVTVPKGQFPVPNNPAFSNSSRVPGINPNAFDQMALLNAMASPVNTYYPWAAKPQAAYINPQFDEPNYYPIQSAQRQRMDMLNQVSNPTTARAVGSYQPDQISGIIQETQRARGNNMQAATNAQTFNAQTYDTLSGQNAQIDTGLYDKTVMSKEQRDIAEKLKMQDVQGAAHNMVNNMTEMQYRMAMNPQFSVSGPFWNHIGFNGNGKGLDSPGSASYGNQSMTREQFLAQYPGYASLATDPQQAYKIDEAMRQERDRQEGLLFKNSRNFSSNMYNPYLAQMTGMGMGYPQAGY
ncbi:MAG TPA: hypothetical protein VGM30_10515 [Puia sp.]|jgi:hypothetical protein